MSDADAANDRTIALQEPMDPTVAALLTDADDDGGGTDDTNVLRTRMGMIRLQQARIHGSATYAATILEQAFTATRQSRELHERLGARLVELEARVAQATDTEGVGADGDSHPDRKPATSAGSSSNSFPSDSHDQLNASDEDEGSDERLSSEEQSQLKEQISALERFLTDRIMSEVDEIQFDRKQLREQELRLKGRITNVLKTVEDLKSNPATAASSTLHETLAQAVTATNEYTPTDATTLSTSCVACQSQPAVRAIIPCGHLCLCDGCTHTLLLLPGSTDKDPSATTSLSSNRLQQCPMCRGSLLSTLKIYTAK